MSESVRVETAAATVSRIALFGEGIMYERNGIFDRAESVLCGPLSDKI
jgi:hypothetical protein